MKRLAILGSTGSIGQSTLDVLTRFPGEFEVVALAARRSVDALAQQAQRYRPRYVGLWEAASAEALRDRLDSTTTLVHGQAGLIHLATLPEVDRVILAMSGSDALVPLLHAVRAGKTVVVANKECLVMGGGWLMREVAAHRATLLPIDSEHNALFQCLEGRDRRDVTKLYLTGSGGPLRTLSKPEIAAATPTMVLNHPKWRMGRKITVDSATLINKGLELIEAQQLFGLPLDQIEIVIHPEAAIHALVEWADGTFTAQLAACDMRIPIQWALWYPEHRASALPRLSLRELRTLTFEPPDGERFPCLRLAQQAARAGGTAPIALNAANEEAVHAFLAQQISFGEIPAVIDVVLSRHTVGAADRLEAILAADAAARVLARASLRARTLVVEAARQEA